MRPFVEMSMVQRLLEHSPVQQFKYLRVLVQEFHVKLELDFLNALLGMFTTVESLDSDDVMRKSYPKLVHTKMQKCFIFRVRNLLAILR
jgi:vacuolar protein sorting-associated protein 13A/C